MKLVLFSGGDEEENKVLNMRLLQLCDNKSPKMTFIPACSYDSEIEFNYFAQMFSALGVSRFIHYPIDHVVDSTLTYEALTSDIIYLGGGNTFYFLKYLRKSGMLKELKSFVARGGILAGLSAGAIMLTPSIETAGFPEFDRDENGEGIRNLKALNLVRFEFFPHYKNSKRYEQELKNYGRTHIHPLYAVADGGGIIVDGESVTFHGRSYCFYQGKKLLISANGPSKKIVKFDDSQYVLFN